ncbi:MAG: hypothetical protein IJC51_03160, partial [Eggerthellaceae bacterium]|nr:hypothetical protein [Eggerthellaceae bacterium]
MAACLVAGTLALAACSPAAPKSNDTGNASQEASSGIDIESMGYVKFTDTDTGSVYPEVPRSQNHKDAQRGCNACHEDLYDQVVNLGPVDHMLGSDPGFGHNATYLDCNGCH